MAAYIPSSLGDTPMAFLVTRPGRAFTFPAAAMPRIGGVPVDIEETADAYRVDLDLPDVDAADVRIDLRDNEIRVAGNYRARVRSRHDAPPRAAGGRVRVPHRAAGRHRRRPGRGEPRQRRADHRRAEGARGAAPAHHRPGGAGSAEPADEAGPVGPAGLLGPVRPAEASSRASSRQRRPAGSRAAGRRPAEQQAQGRSQPETGPADTPAAQAKQMREGQSRPGPASQQAGSTGTGSTGQVGRSGMS